VIYIGRHVDLFMALLNGEFGGMCFPDCLFALLLGEVKVQATHLQSRHVQGGNGKSDSRFLSRSLLRFAEM